MRFLFPATVVLEGEKCDYNIYEFKLRPGKYKAQLLSQTKRVFIKEVIFWKEKNHWMTTSNSKLANHLVQILGRDIDHFRN